MLYTGAGQHLVAVHQLFFRRVAARFSVVEQQDRQIPEKCDVVVIGAGAGGLTAAALLAQAGLKTVVFEADSQVGGYLAGFQRRGFHFNTSVEWLNQCAPGGFVHNIFRHLGGDFPICPPMQRIRRFKSETFDYLLTDHPEELRDALIRDYPADEAGIRAFFRDAEALGERLRLLDKKTMARATMAWHEKLVRGLEMLCWSLPIIRYVRTPIDKGLRRYFRTPGPRAIFNSHESLMAVMVSIAWASSGNVQACPVGGSAALAAWLQRYITAAGSQVLVNRRVERVLVDGRGHACGVALADGTEVAATYIIAASDLQTLYERMLPPQVIPKKLLQGLLAADLYSSYFSVYLGLDCSPANLGFGEEAIHLTRTDVPREEQSGGDPARTMIAINAPSLRDPSLAPPGKGTLTIHCPACFEAADRWHTGAGLTRGADYQRYKTEFADILIDRVAESVAPGLREHIEVKEIATPITYWRYTGNTKGSMSGAKPTAKNIRAKIAHYQTPVPHLLIGGHYGEYGGGVPMAIKAGTNASLIVLQALKPEAYRQLRDVLNGNGKKG
jgi:prolycopene isomerase